jgi:long-chain fatty acid transport protein
MKMQVHRRTRFVLASAILTVPVAMPVALHAQAFGLNEIGSCAVGRAYAVTASPCRDASTIFWNPAAATWVNGWNVTAGVAAIAVDGSFTQDTSRRKFNSEVPTSWVPHVFINYHSPTSKAAFGVGVYVPYGLTSQWSNDFPGRFSAKKATLSTVYVQPNFAWQITPEWSIGGGPIYGHSSVELIQSLDLSQQSVPGVGSFGQIGIATGTEFARARIKGSADAWGAQIGVAGHPSPNWSVGARFMTPLEFKYDNADATFNQVATNLVVGGDLPGPGGTTAIKAGTPVDAVVGPQFQSGGALVAQNASTKITHPAQIQAGVAYSGYKNWLLEADYAFIGWKRFDVLPVTFDGPAASSSRTLIENYNNSSAIRLGAEYTIPTDGWKLRAGFAGVASAAPPETVTPLLPEQDRSYGTFGIGIPIMKTFTLDASYAHIFTPGARGRTAERVVGQPSANLTASQINTGVFDLSANVFSFTIKASF